MLRRIAARLLTGPSAFLLGGVVDLLAFAAASWRARWSARQEERGPPGAPPPTSPSDPAQLN